ncbi:MAG: hypothetical protein MJ137_09405, partial [Clostridia bacterium]|nr:hypothetical protein [Clostridia bacterium]
YSDGKWYSVKGRSDVRALSVSGGGDALAGTLDACLLRGPVDAEIHRVLSEGRMLMTGKNISADCGETPSLQGRRIVTAVDQSALRENCPLSPGERTELGRGEAIVNGGFRYVNLCGLPLIAKAERRSGSFSRNNEELKGAPAAEADIFTVYYDHGPAESINGPDYACEIIRETRKNIGEW